MTLIEIMVVLGIFVVLISLGAVVDLNAFKSDTLQTEETKVVSLLEKARSRSMANLYQSSHGFCYVSPNYVIFHGRATCLPVNNTDENIPANVNIASNASTSIPTTIFTALSGNTSGNPTINLSDGNKTVHIIINNEGTVNW